MAEIRRQLIAQKGYADEQLPTQELVGHEDITTTLRIYSHVLPSMQQGVADKLGELFNRGL